MDDFARRCERAGMQVQTICDDSGEQRIIRLFAQEGEIADTNDASLWTRGPTKRYPGTYIPGQGRLVVHWRRDSNSGKEMASDPEQYPEVFRNPVKPEQAK